MSSAKLIVLLLISFIATGSIVYQIRNRRRPAQTAVVVPASGFQTMPAANAPASPTPASPAPTAPAAGVPPSDASAPRVTVPANGWGRNPFLTVDEINRMNQPAVQVAEAPVQQRPAEPAGLPNYEVTGILSGNQGVWAIIGPRAYQVGNKLGGEILREIRDHSVVLEYEGRMRELPLKRMEDVKPAAPKKEAKP